MRSDDKTIFGLAEGLTMYFDNLGHIKINGKQ